MYAPSYPKRRVMEAPSAFVATLCALLLAGAFVCDSSTDPGAPGSSDFQTNAVVRTPASVEVETRPSESCVKLNDRVFGALCTVALTATGSSPNVKVLV